MADRKILSTDFANLKAKVKAEMLRRNKTGSVAAYGGSQYDYQVAPVDQGPLKGEHLSKITTPMRAVNPNGIPEYPGDLTAEEMASMEAKINAWQARAVTDRSGTDCAASCTGLCYTSCIGTCVGCGGCDGSCSGCGGCDYSCSGCGGCDYSCSGCGYSCGDSCSGCGYGCGGGCDGCSGCGGCGGCDNSCTDNCTSRCCSDCSGTAIR